MKNLLLLLLLLTPSLVHGQASMQVSPPAYFTTDETPYGYFTVTNTGNASLEVIVLTDYAMLVNTIDDSPGIVTPDTSRVGDLTGHISLYPDYLTLAPGDYRSVRYMVENIPEDDPPKGYAALVRFRINEQSPVAQENVPLVSAGLTIQYELATPLAHMHGEGTPEIRARIHQIDSSSVTVMMDNETTFPFKGDISVFAQDNFLGKMVTTLFSHQIVTIPFDESLSDFPSHLRLEFAPSGLGMNSDEISHRYNAPAPVTVSIAR